MRYYETLYLINPDLADEEYGEVVSKFNNFVESNKGILIKVEEWGKKPLAYEVKKFDRGYYVLLQYCGEPDILEDLKREFRLDERILKYQTVKLSDNEDPEILKAKVEEASTARQSIGVDEDEKQYPEQDNEILETQED